MALARSASGAIGLRPGGVLASSDRVRVRQAGDAMINYGRPGPLGDDIEEVIAGKVRELVGRGGGKPAVHTELPQRH